MYKFEETNSRDWNKILKCLIAFKAYFYQSYFMDDPLWDNKVFKLCAMKIRKHASTGRLRFENVFQKVKLEVMKVKLLPSPF